MQTKLGWPMSDAPDGWPFRHSIRVRYQEIDMQRVVFNAHYLAYCDEVMAAWLTEAFGWSVIEDRIDWMLVKLLLEWQGSATFGEVLDIDCGIVRWGTTSFDVAFRGSGRESSGVHCHHHVRVRHAWDHGEGACA